MTAAEKQANTGNVRDDEGKVTPFEQDVLLSEEYLATFRRTVHLEPEKRLMLALLEDAIACYQKFNTPRRPREKTLFEATEEWIFSKEPGWFFSFENVCEMLGIDPDYLRKGLLKWRQEREGTKAKVYQLVPRKISRKGGLKASEHAGCKHSILKNGTD